MPVTLLITRDSAVRDEVERLAAASGLTVTTVGEPGLALASWRRASAVVVGADAIGDVGALGPPRRASVYVAAWGLADEEIFRPALAVGAEGVVELPSGGDWLAATLADAGEGRRHQAVTVGVIGGSGGAGASCFATALAQTAAATRSAVLVDADPWGPGLATLLGATDASGVRWPDLRGSAGRLGAVSLREALPMAQGLPFLTWGDRAESAPADLMARVLSAARRSSELVVVDLGRTLDPGAAEAFAGADVVLMVVVGDTAGIASARRLLDLVPDRSRVRLVVRGRAVDPVEYEELLGVPVILTMPPQRGLSESIDLGLGPLRHRRGPLGRAVAGLLPRLVLHAGGG